MNKLISYNNFNTEQLLESIKFASVEEYLDMLESFNGYTLVFVDLETTGMIPDYDQILEIGAVAIDPMTWDEIDTFNKLIVLDNETKGRMDHEEDIEHTDWLKRTIHRLGKPVGKGEIRKVLKMTGYEEDLENRIEVEECALKSFYRWLDKMDNCMLLSYNASFDMHFLAVRGKRKLKKYPVLDVIVIVRDILIPGLKFLQAKGDRESKQFLQSLTKMGKDGNVRYSAAMTKIANGYGINTDDLHTAIGDTYILIEVMQELLLFMYKHKNMKLRLR